MSESKECSPKPGSFSWNELIATNPSASADFYRKLFGWQAVPFVPSGAPPGLSPYTLFKMDGNDKGIGGMAKPIHSEAPTRWIPYVVVENIDASVAKASELEAKVIVPVMSLGEVGRIAIIQDPQGATLGLHELSK